ncbi:MAG: F0F1 ATP synthase subunit B [Bacteroidales bacterium]|jgi:F-type H+-transporting ATPase subunit b|nr:F0F1 ATP synthase subunit B [Bacteroidales bacterium]
MSLLTPEPGLLFWMTISFGIVVFILVKYGFPPILKAVDQRNNYIEESLKSAREAKEELSKVKVTSELILADARKEQKVILKEATRLSELIINEAKENAIKESDKILAKARTQINADKEEALKSIRSEVTKLSVALTEKILREKLSSEKEQMGMIDRLLDEIEISKS